LASWPERSSADEPACVPGVGPHQGDRVERLAQRGGDAERAVPVLQGGGRDHDGQQQPAGVDRDLPLAALDLLPAVLPAAGGRDGVGGADGLRVDHGRGQPWATPVGKTRTFTQRCVDPAPRPRAGPPAGQA